MEQLDQRELARAMNEQSNALIVANAYKEGAAGVAKAVRDSGTAWWMAVAALAISAVAAGAQVWPLLFK